MATDALTDERILHLVDVYVGGPSPNYPLDNSDWITFARAIEGELRAALASAPAAAEHPLMAPEALLKTIGTLLGDAMNTAVENGANSVSMPDEYVALAAWLCETPAAPPPAEPAQPAPQAGAAESYADLWNALQAIDTAAVSLPGFEVRHEGGIEAVTKNIVEAIQRVAAHPTEQPSQDAEDAARYRWLREQHWNEADFCVVRDPRRAVRLGHDCPSLERLDAAIDAARAAQAQGGANG